MPETESLRRWRAERRVLLDLLLLVERRGDPRLPWDALPALGTVVGDREAVLAALAARWSRALYCHLDAVLDLPGDERGSRANDVAAELAAREPALHAVLIHHADLPPVARARARDAGFAGLPGLAAHAEHVRSRYRVVDGAAVTTRPVSVVARAVAATARHCPVYRAATRHGVASRAA